MITELFDDTVKDWSNVLTCLKILVDDGRPVKISKDKDGILFFQYTYKDNEELVWIDENHYVGERDISDPSHPFADDVMMGD